MKKWTKKLSVVLCMMLFMALAIGSADSDDDEEKTASTKVEAVNDKSSTSSVDSKESSSEGTNNESESKESVNEESAKGLQYEITDSRFEYYENSIGDIEYYGIVEVTNTGDCNMYMDKCTFDLEDNTGHLLQSDSSILSCPQVVAPGEKGYFYNGLGSSRIDKSVSLDNGVKLAPQLTISKAKEMPHRYPTSDVSISKDDMWGIKITGRVENDTTEKADLLYVRILCYDKDGKVILIVGTTMMDVAAGNKASFDTKTVFSNDNIKFEDIVDTKVIVEPLYYQF